MKMKSSRACLTSYSDFISWNSFNRPGTHTHTHTHTHRQTDRHTHTHAHAHTHTEESMKCLAFLTNEIKYLDNFFNYNS